jgi:NAD(P)-dependent dehydrogenase (short-subunit alcohol dehydrogenase family)
MSNVLITGTSSGFGLLGALTFARKGVTVFASLRNLEKAGPLKEARDAEKLPIHIIELDVTSPESVARAMREVEAAGPLDALINNAGAELASPIEEASDDEIRWQFDTNVLGAVRMIRAVLPGMRARRAGTIVNVSSIAGLLAAPFAGYYAASKHALEAISEALHFEVTPYNIRVAVVEPGRYETGFHGNIRPAAKFTADSPYQAEFQKYVAAFARISPPGAQDPQEVADALYHAVFTDESKLRYVVGRDAQGLATLRKQLDFEGYEREARKLLDWH